MNNIYVLNKNYKKIGTLSNQGANPQAPYYEDLYTQELDTGADTYYFSTMSTPYTQDLLEIGNHIMFTYKNRNELFTITSLEYSHNEGYKTIGVYAEGIGFDLLEVYMERPEVPEKEEGKDNGGSDKIYIDEDGNIIYDPDGDGETGGDITIDGDGNIIYTPSRNNKKNDSLEFKNISYPRFLSMLLKNSGWSYVCQPGLESVKHDITVKYDTNIYAILQDSMQSYRGVELEFVHEYNGGRVQKVIKAYKDGGRGSFVGKRFEYGTNVRGITKMQEVANSEDDTVLYVDDIGINITYDIDFALKSAEVPEIEIGDTHYVIDRDFYPPMTIKARIGKIEVSFSDPTVNKIYLANNKRISGSAIEDEFNEDDIKDIIDDYDPGDPDIPDDPGDPDVPDDPDDPGSGGDLPDHDHNCLKDYNEDSYIFLRHESLPDTYTCPFSGYEYTDGMFLEPEPYGDTYSAIGGTDSPWNFIYGDSVNCKRLTATDARSVISNNIENSVYVDSLGVRSTRYMVKMPNNRIENATTMSTKDLYDFIKNLTICKYTNKEETALLDDGNSYTFGIYNADNYANSGNSIAGGIFRKLYDVSNGNPARVGSGFIENSLLCALIGAFQQHIGAGDSGSGGGDDGTGGDSGGNSGNYATVTYVDDQINCVVDSISINYLSKVEAIANYATIEYVDSKLGSGGGSTPSNPGTGGCIFEKVTNNEGKSYYYTDNSLYIQNDLEVSGALILHDDGEGTSANSGTVDCDILKVVKIEFHNGTTMTTAGGHVCDEIFTWPGDVNLSKGLYTWDNRGKLHIGNNYTLLTIFEHPVSVDGNLSADAIYVSDGIYSMDGTPLVTANSAATVSTDLSEYATVEALQEEIRAKDEQIASLEARLARIEAMLGINND